MAGGVAGHEALAKKPKAKLQATVDGKKFKTRKRVPPTAAYQSLTGLLTVIGASQKGGIRSVSIKTLQFSAQIDLAAATLPVTVPAFTALYSDNTYRGVTPGAPKSWAGEGLSVTVTKFDGARIAGTFEGSLPPGGGGVTSPANVARGKFDLPVLVQ